MLYMFDCLDSLGNLFVSHLDQSMILLAWLFAHWKNWPTKQESTHVTKCMEGHCICTYYYYNRVTQREIIHEGLKAKRFTRYRNSGILHFDTVKYASSLL